MLNNNQINKLADDLIAGIDLVAWLATFEWDGKVLQPAWASRLALGASGFADGAEDFADRVHRWGFRKQAVSPSIRQHASYSLAMRTLCTAWSEDREDWPGTVAIDSLVTLLDIKHLGIARVSKFICFLDQSRYAIYDSRVSYALKDLTLDGATRVFPFIGGRQVKSVRYVSTDPAAGNPGRMAAVYVGFVRLLQRAAEKLNAEGGITDPRLRQVVGGKWTPALLEMALFMAGQYRIKTAGIRGFDGRIWDTPSKPSPRQV